MVCCASQNYFSDTISPSGLLDLGSHLTKSLQELVTNIPVCCQVLQWSAGLSQNYFSDTISPSGPLANLSSVLEEKSIFTGAVPPASPAEISPDITVSTTCSFATSCLTTNQGRVSQDIVHTWFPLSGKTECFVKLLSPGQIMSGSRAW